MQRGPDTRQCLMNAAAALFERHGFGGACIRDITDSAHANLGAVNYYFKSKAALFSAVMEPKLAILVRCLNAILESRDTAPRKLGRLYREYVQCVLSREPSLRAVFSDAIHGGRHLTQDLMALLLSLQEVAGRIIHEGIEQGVFRDGNVEHTVRMIFGTIAPFLISGSRARRRNRMARYTRAEVDNIADSGLNLIMNGLVVSDRRRSPT